MESNNTTLSDNKELAESIVPPSLQFSFGLFGNVLALIILVKNSKDHGWKPFHRLVCGLVLTDISSILLIFPSVLVRYGSGFTFIYSQGLCQFLSFFTSFIPLSSATIIAFMSAERFAAVFFPFRYLRNDRRKQTTVTLILIWLSSGFICSLHLFGFGKARLVYPGTWCFLDFFSTDTQDKINALIYGISGTIMLAATVALNTCVVICLVFKFKCARTHKEGMRNESDALGYTIGTLVAIVVIFIVCTLPILVRLFTNITTEAKDKSADLLAARLMASNSILNPWVYILVRKDVIGVLVNMLTCRRSDSFQEDPRVDSSMEKTEKMRISVV